MENIIKKHFEAEVQSQLQCTPQQAGKIVDVMVNYLHSQLNQHNRIEFRNTLILEPVVRKAKKGQLITSTGSTGSVHIPARKTYKLRMPKKLVKTINTNA